MMDNKDLQAGSDFCLTLGPLMKRSVERAENPVHWWAGFIGAISGFAASDIGADAVKIIAESCEGIVSEEILKKQIKLVDPHAKQE